MYSGISDSGHFEIRTVSLQRTQLEVPKYFLPIVLKHFESLKEDNLLTKDKSGYLKMSFIRRFHMHVLYVEMMTEKKMATHAMEGGTVSDKLLINSTSGGAQLVLVCASVSIASEVFGASLC